MSFNISPDKHLRLISQTVIFTENVSVGDTLLKISINHDYFYSQQEIELSNNLSGKILFTLNDSDTYLLLNNKITTNIESGFVATTNVPFRAEEDDDVVSQYDLYNAHSTEVLTINGIKFKGKDGLFKSEWLQKINEIKSLQVLSAISFDLNTSTQGLLGYVKFDGKHKFGFRNSIIDVLFEIDVNDSRNSYTIRKMNFDNFEGSLKLSFSIGKINNERYIAVYVSSVNDQLTDSIVYARQEIKSSEDVSNTGNGFIVDYQINNIVFDQSIYSVNSNGKDLFINQPIEIKSATVLRDLTEGSYYCNDTRSFIIQNLPDLDNGITLKSFVLTVHKVKSDSTLKVLDIVMVVDNTIIPTHNIIKASLYVDGNIDYSWVFDDNIQASKVVQDDNHKFVTQTQINNWNTESTWLSPVRTFSDLPVSDITYGSSCFVISEKEIYHYDLDVWTKSTNIVSETQDGILTKEQYKQIFVEKSTFKTIKSTTSINRESTISEAQYNNYIGTNIIDLTKRTTISSEIGSNVINFVYADDNDSNREYGTLGTNSVGVGKNLYGRGSNVILIGNDTDSANKHNIVSIGKSLIVASGDSTYLGQYNEGLTNNVLEIGGGTSNERKNILSIDRTNNIVTAGGFAVPGGTSDQILLADGSRHSIGSLSQVFNSYLSSTSTGTYTYYGIKELSDNGDILGDESFGENSIFLTGSTLLDETKRTGLYSVSLNSSVAIGNYSIAVGENNIVNTIGTLVLGRNNFPIFNSATNIVSPNMPLLIIGNGSSTTRSNAYVVDNTGNSYQGGNINLKAGKGFKLKTEDGSKSALITLVRDSATNEFRLKITEVINETDTWEKQ